MNLDLFNVPILDIGDRQGNTDYIDFIEEDEMGDNNIMKGVDKFNREFLVIRVKCNEKKYFQTFFKRYSSDKSIWMGCSKFRSDFMITIGGMNDNQFNFLNSLIKNGEITIHRNDIQSFKLYNFPKNEESSLKFIINK